MAVHTKHKSINGESDCDAAKKVIRKIEIYEALYGLNAGIQQFLDSLDFLERAGLGLPFLNGYRIVADEIRSAINFSTTEVMNAIEYKDYKQLESERLKSALSRLKNPDEKSIQRPNEETSS